MNLDVKCLTKNNGLLREPLAFPTSFMILMREGHGVIIYINEFLDYLALQLCDSRQQGYSLSRTTIRVGKHRVRDRLIYNDSKHHR